MSTISPTRQATLAATPRIASATAPNWLAEAQTAIVTSSYQGGMLGALQNSKQAPGSISSFLNNTVSNSSSFALIAQNSVSASGTLASQIGSAIYRQALVDKLSKLNPPAQVNYTPPKGLAPIIYFDDGTTLDTVNNILTFTDGTQIDTTTGGPVIDPKSIINMPDGSYLDTKNNVLTMANGTKIDTITGLNITV